MFLLWGLMQMKIIWKVLGNEYRDSDNIQFQICIFQQGMLSINIVQILNHQHQHDKTNILL